MGQSDLPPPLGVRTAHLRASASEVAGANAIDGAEVAGSADAGARRGPRASSDDHTLLLVEDNPAEARRITRLVACGSTNPFEVHCVPRLSEATQVLAERSFCAALIDLATEDAQGAAPLEQLIASAPDLPVVVVGDWFEQAWTVQALRAGAQDFVLRRRLDASGLAQTLTCAIDRKRADHRIAGLIHVDQQSQLPNRGVFRFRLDDALAEAHVASRQVGLLFIRVEGFAEIRAQLGAAAADQVISDVAAQLRCGVRRSEMVARLDASTFGIISVGLTKQAALKGVASRLAAQVKKVDAPLTLTPRVVAGVTEPHVALDETLERLEYALHFGRATDGPIALVPPTQRGEPAIAAIEAAVRGQEFTLNYQPRLDLDDGTVPAVEAFLRWAHPELGLLRPRSFLAPLGSLPVADDLNAWVISEVCRQRQAWMQAGLSELRIVINVSPAQFHASGFADELVDLVASAGESPAGFELDVAEALVLENPAWSRMWLKRLQAVGFRTALDDFQVGLTKLAELAKLPLDVLKIDGSVVAALDQSPACRTQAAAAIALGRELAVDVVAEGVERDAQVRILRDLGATTVQGFWFAAPKTPDEIARWWAERTARRRL